MTRLLPHLRADEPLTRGGTRSPVRVLEARRRVAHLAAEGRAAPEIAEAEGVEAGEVEALLADRDFALLVRAYRVLGSKPTEAQRARLVALAHHLIDEAIALGHVRVGFFVVRERLHGRDAAETLADKLLAQRAKAARPPPPEPPPRSAEAPTPPAKPHLPAHPADRMAQRACAQLLKALLHEFRLRAEAKARARAAERTASAIGHAPLPRVEGWHRRLATRLLTTAAAVRPEGDWPPRLSQAP